MVRAGGEGFHVAMITPGRRVKSPSLSTVVVASTSALLIVSMVSLVSYEFVFLCYLAYKESLFYVPYDGSPLTAAHGFNNRYRLRIE